MPIFASAQREELRKLIQSLPQLHEQKAYIDALNRIAMLSHLRYRDSCRIYAEKALVLSRKQHYENGIADALNNQGIYYISVNNYQSALYFNDALEIYRKLGNRENESQMLMNLSVLLFTDKNEKEALRYIYKAEQISRHLPNDSIRSIILSDILTLDRKLSVKEYGRIFREGQAIAEKHRDYRMMISYANNEGTMLYNAGKREEGLKILLDSEKLADSVGCEYVKVSAIMTIGEMYLDMKRDQEGIAYYEKGLYISKKFGYPERSLVFAERLYDYYKQIKNTPKTLRYAMLLLAEQTKIQKATTESGYNYVAYVQQKQRISNLTAENRTQSRLVIGLGIVLAVLAAMAFLLWKLYAGKKEKAKVEQELKLLMASKNAELEDRNKFNMMLLTILAHDVRQPFSNMIMTSNLLREQSDVFSNDEKDDLFREMEDNAHQSIFFMDGVLSWIKSRKEGHTFPKEKIAVHELVREANLFLERLQLKNELQLVLDIPDGFFVYANKMIMAFTVRNVLHNAYKFAPKGSSIFVTVEEEGHRKSIVISDQGRGMTQEMAERLFKPKHEAKDAFGRGAGVALAICYEMLEQTGCLIRVETQLGLGTRFFIDCGELQDEMR